MSTFFSSKTARGTDTQQKIQRSLFSDIRAILTKCEKPCSCHAQLDKLIAFHLTHNEEKVQKKTSVTTKPKSRKSPHKFSKKMGYLTRASSADSGISSCSPKGRRILEDKSIKMVSWDNIFENPAMHGDGQAVRDSPETDSVLIANSVVDTRPITPRNRKMVKSNLFSSTQNSSKAQNILQITEMTLSERRKSTRKTRVPSFIIDKGQAPPTSVQDSPETGSLLIANSVMDTRPITPRNRKMVKSNLFSGIQNSSNAQNKSQITEMTLSERRKSTRKTRVPSSIIDLKVHDVIQKILLKRQKHKRQKLSFNRTTTSTATISDEESSIKKRKSVNRSGKTDKISKVLRKSDLKPVKEISERRSLPIAKAKSSSNIIKSAKRNETRRLSDLKIQDVIPKKRLPNRTTSSTALHEPNPKSVERASKQVQKATTLRKSDINPRAQISNNSTETLRKSLQLAKAKSSSNIIKPAIRNEAVRVIAPFINTQPVTKIDFRKLARGSWMLDRSENNLSDSSFINRRTSPRHKKSPTRSSPRRKKRRLYSPEQVMISKQFLSLLENE